MAATPSVASIKKHFRRLHDPRVAGRTKHLLIDLLVMALCGVTLGLSVKSGPPRRLSDANFCV